MGDKVPERKQEQIGVEIEQALADLHTLSEFIVIQHLKTRENKDSTVIFSTFF